MPEQRNNPFSNQILKMIGLSTSPTTNLMTCDEEIAGEADEPPDNRNQHLLHSTYHSDGEFMKLAVSKPVAKQSLISAALTSPALIPVDSRKRTPADISSGCSAASYWSLSAASTAELTSDGGLSSRSQSPSPQPPTMVHVLEGIFGRRNAAPKPAPVPNNGEVLEELGRKRCIKFACNAASKPAHPVEESTDVDAVPKRAPTIKFACNDAPKKELTSSPQATRPQSMSSRSSSSSGQEQPLLSPTSYLKPIRIAKTNVHTAEPLPRFHEFASSCEDTESWMTQGPDSSRLLRVDGVLDKEKKIRKLSEEVEAEKAEEEELEAEVNNKDEDEDEDDDDEDENEVHNNMSGDESDNEEGFASESDDEDDEIFERWPVNNRSPMFSPRPNFARRSSDSSLESFKGFTHKPRRTKKKQVDEIQLPDNSEFVCGALDEDREIEDAYLSAIEEKKRSMLTPQDIDPGFPSEQEDSDELEDIDEEDEEFDEEFDEEEDADDLDIVEPTITRSRVYSSDDGKLRFRSPAPNRRGVSPAPKRRLMSPPPLTRRNSEDQAIRPVMVRRNSRTMSPPPPTRRTSTLMFGRPGADRTKSLPKVYRPPVRRGRSLDGQSEEDKTPQSTPGIHTRGAIDIVKGLEKKRERRHNKLSRQHQQRSSFKQGEGVEKMRELGLMLGKGKPAQWMISV